MENKSLNSTPSIFNETVDVRLANQIMKDLKEQNFEFSTPPYTIFCAKKTGIVCTFYTSGKLVVQGKGTREFVEFYLEPSILKRFTLHRPSALSIKLDQNLTDSDLDLSPQIGIDESGKGDFFGPLCIAGVFAEGKQIERLRDIGVKDSKTLTPATIDRLAKQIQKEFTHHIVKINPLKYNELIIKFGNLNHLLAWGHATTIEQLVEKTGCNRIIIDQFAHEKVVITALKRKKLTLDLTQRHRAEEVLVVAAASILARYTFVESLKLFEKEYNQPFPKGASAATIKAGRHFVETHGKEELKKVGKVHFKTLDSILGKQSQ